MSKTTTVKYLEEKGYQRYDSTNQYSDALYQKKFFDDNGNAKYYINVDHYNFDNVKMSNEARKNYEFEYMTQLISKATNCPINITLFSGWQIDDAEEHIEMLYNSGMYKQYE